VHTPTFVKNLSRVLWGLIALAAIIAVFSGRGLAAGSKDAANAWHGPKAKYVFLFIGDGLGLQQISSAEIYQASLKNSSKPSGEKLSFSAFANQGMATTYSTNSFITDSAPAGTALATGYKTENGVIGVDPSKTRKFATIAEEAKAAGMKVGIVSTVSLNHATPASFYAHVPSRNSYYDIGLQLLNSRFDYVAGGGLHKHADKDASGNPRQDLYGVAASKGFTVARDQASILALKPGKAPVLAVNPVLDSSDAMPYAMDKGASEVSLAQFVDKGIQLLDNPKGFFLMVEGGKIDWACHANDAAASIHDILAFDESVKLALDFAKKHPADTLIVVTGDHETGGLGIGFAGTQYSTFFDKIGGQRESYLAFDKEIADLRKTKGAQATLDDIKDSMAANFGLKISTPEEWESLRQKAKAGDKEAAKTLGLTLSPLEQGRLKDALAASMADKKDKDPTSQDYLLYGGYEPLSIAITHILNNKAGIGWTSYAHTGIPVPVFASGTGSSIFRGYYDNTDVAWKIFNIMGLKTLAPITTASAQ